MRQRRKPTRRKQLGRREPTADGLLYCPICDTYKPVPEFPFKGKHRNGDQRYGYCKPCHNVYQRENKLRNVFNVTVEEAATILVYQHGLCAVCQRPAKDGGVALSLDHSHGTGLLRGYLCWLCNKALGVVRDDPERLRRMITYLEAPPATAALGEERYGRVGRTSNKASTRKRASTSP